MLNNISTVALNQEPHNLTTGGLQLDGSTNGCDTKQTTEDALKPTCRHVVCLGLSLELRSRTIINTGIKYEDVICAGSIRYSCSDALKQETRARRNGPSGTLQHRSSRSDSSSEYVSAPTTSHPETISNSEALRELETTEDPHNPRTKGTLGIGGTICQSAWIQTKS